jgi:hypothetical protein
VPASVSKHRAMSYAHLQARETELAAEVQARLDQLETQDTADDAPHGSDPDGGSAPPGLADAQQRLATIQAAKARLEAQAQARPQRPAAGGPGCSQPDGADELLGPGLADYAQQLRETTG